MQKIHAYLSFPEGKCREAMGFYHGIFGGKLNVMTVSGSPMEAELPPHMKDYISHADISAENIFLMGADFMAPVDIIVGNNISVMYAPETEEEAHQIFNQLADGGQVVAPLKKEFWGAIFGMLIDKFGINWMVHYDLPREE